MRLLTMVHISDLHLGRVGGNGFDARAPHWPNSLLVHRLREEGGEVLWETEIYLERTDGFFAADQVLSRVSGENPADPSAAAEASPS
jgi:hypothetical protein